MGTKLKFNRRAFIGATSGLLWTVPAWGNNLGAGKLEFTASRVWPAQAYTRITLESNEAARYQYFVLEKPHRLIIDIENIKLNSVLQSLAKKVQGADPYVGQIRVGQKDANTVRLVFDLKTSTLPQVFNLMPVANFKHRMVIDIYPAQFVDDDPILALLNAHNREKEKASKNQDKSSGNKNNHLAKNDNKNDKNPDENKNINKNQNIEYKQNRRPIIMVDAGHGGEDPGAISPQGFKEKDVVLMIARETKSRLEALGYKVHMTRDEDVFLPLKTRVAIAQRANADLFISIHADSAGNDKARGSSVYALSQSGATNEAARLLAESQNDSDRIGGIEMSHSREVNNVLVDMVQNQTINDSLRLGRFILNQIGKFTTLKFKQVEQANFVVLRSPDIPSVLVETAYLSNHQDELLLRDPEFRRKMAQAIADGVKQYLNVAILARR